MTYTRDTLKDWRDINCPDVNFDLPRKGQVVYISAPKYLPSYRIVALGAGRYTVETIPGAAY